MILWIFLLISALTAVLTGLGLGWFAGWAVLKVLLAIVGVYAGLVAAFLLLVLVSSWAADPKKPCENDSPYYRWLAHQLMIVGCFFGRVHIHSTGVEKVPQTGRFLLVTNHLYDLDPVVIMRTLKKIPLAFVSKKENSQIPVAGRVLPRLLCLPLDRENDREALKTILKAAKFLKEDKISVAIFPEGYCSKTGELLSFRNGAFKIAQRAKVPIVVAVLGNTKAIAKNIFRRTTHVTMDILDVVPAETVEELNTAELGEQIHKMMEEGIACRKAIGFAE